MTLSPRAIEAAIEEYRGGGSCCSEDAMRAAIESALAVDGLCLVPKEPTAKMIAAAFPTEGERPPPDDMKIGAEAILILEGGRDCGSITGPAVIEAASMCKDYRKMLAAASDGDSPRKTEGK
ncbi:hypothetical protein [Nitrobacter sp. TKz-YC01]|uniref:hypothetical protein n=1 Tax=Nitrobacter sp. TKz-YC01 TaxID=3398703 RepID=UPI003A0FFBD5